MAKELEMVKVLKKIYVSCEVPIYGRRNRADLGPIKTVRQIYGLRTADGDKALQSFHLSRKSVANVQ